MKVIGLMLTWNNLEFLKCSLKQALEFCDEVLLAEGCSSMNYPWHSTDGTCEYIREMQDHRKLKVINPPHRHQGNYQKVQCAMRQSLLISSNIKPGDWLTAWDDDMFFFDKDLVRLKKEMTKTTYDTLAFRERRFIYNFQFNTIGKGKWFFHRYTNGCFYKPLMRLFYRYNKPYVNLCYLNHICYFHFNYIKRPERIKARWQMSIEKGTPSSIGRFEKWMAIKWNGGDDIFKSKADLEAIQGQSNLNIYNGKLPEALENHPWRHIDDIRNFK